MTLEFYVESECLRVCATGAFSLAEAKRTFLEMLEAVARHKVRKVLFDGRMLTGEPKTMERFYYGAFAAKTAQTYADRGVSLATKFAYVLEKPVLDPRRFGQLVAENRGLTVMAFERPAEAFGWLGTAPANVPDAGESGPAHEGK